MYRRRSAKIVATLGPASRSPEMIEKLVDAGADVFRLNFSHGNHDDHRQTYRAIRDLETKLGRGIGILMDLQGPKLRIGKIQDGEIMAALGERFRFTLDETPGADGRIPLCHPEVYAAVNKGSELLINDGRIRMSVIDCASDFIDAEVVVPGKLSDNKGVNLPNTLLDISPLTEKDRRDLAFGLDLGVDWVALSFVQRPSDVAEARRLVENRASIMVKLEKPAAIHCVDELIAMTDGVMVARGDLGVELPPEEVPSLQKQIVRKCREAGRPVIVATQMLESMVSSPTPTRAEASDVATAIYDGADAVMLSAESAVGEFPVEAVTIMNKVIAHTERDPHFQRTMETDHPIAERTASDAITKAAAQVADTIGATAIATYTTSGSTALRAARERPPVPILGLTPKKDTARKLALLWGLHCVETEDATDIDVMVSRACQVAKAEGLAKPGDRLVITAGMPFGTPGATNILRIAWVGD